MGVYLQNPRSGGLFFPVPSGGRLPLKMKYTYPSTLGDIVQNIYGYGVYPQNPRSGCLLFLAPSGGRHPLEIKCTYPSTLDHVVSECIWLWGSISKTLGVVACIFLHLQEGYALWK